MKKIDYHCHFSGSLSSDYLCLCSSTSDVFMPKFGTNWEENFKLFFDCYKRIQSVTKTVDPENQTILYTSGSRDICSKYIQEGVDEFHLRIGPRTELQETIRRLNSTINGFKQAETQNRRGKVGKLILTLIHDQHGYFHNVNNKSLMELLRYLENDKYLADRILGFDFSGPENSINQKDLFDLLGILCKYNQKHSNRYEIAVHAGEYIDTHNYKSQYKYLEKLLNCNISRLSHGTLLWIDPLLVDPENEKFIAKTQNRLLEILAKKRIHLEINPTANFLLSPLRNISDIPILRFEEMNILYSINTDNKQIFNTTLEKEWSYFPFIKANPFETAVNGSKISSLSPNMPTNSF